MPLLEIDRDLRLNAEQKEVCNNAVFPELISERYHDQLAWVLLYNEDHEEWDSEDSDASSLPEEPNYYDSDENYFNA